MSLASSTVTAAQRAAATTDITRTLTTAGTRAASVSDQTLIAQARAPFTMVEHEPRVVEDFLNRFHDAVIWKHDGNCFNRAMLGVHMLDEMTGLGAGPADDVFAGAIHVEQELDRVGALTGRFHGSAAIRIKGHDDPYVVDFLHDRPFVRVRADDLPEVTQLIRPYAGTGAPWLTGGSRTNWVGAPFFDGARQNLTAAWSKAAQRDLKPHELADTIRAVHQLDDARVPLADNRKISLRANDAVSFD